MECRKKAEKCILSKICHCKFLPPILIFLLFFKKKRREAECVYMGIRRGVERKEGVSQEERKRQVFFLRFIRKNILLSDNAK